MARRLPLRIYNCRRFHGSAFAVRAFGEVRHLASFGISRYLEFSAVRHFAQFSRLGFRAVQDFAPVMISPRSGFSRLSEVRAV